MIKLTIIIGKGALCSIFRHDYYISPEGTMDTLEILVGREREREKGNIKAGDIVILKSPDG